MVVGGDGFRFVAHTGIGGFWLSFATTILLSRGSPAPPADEDIGCFLVAYSLFIIPLAVASLRRSKVEFLHFFCLSWGMLLAAVGRFQKAAPLSGINMFVAWDLLFVGLLGFYGLFHAVLLDAWGYDALGLGTAFWPLGENRGRRKGEGGKVGLVVPKTRAAAAAAAL